MRRDMVLANALAAVWGFPGGGLRSFLSMLKKTLGCDPLE